MEANKVNLYGRGAVFIFCLDLHSDTIASTKLRVDWEGWRKRKRGKEKDGKEERERKRSEERERDVERRRVGRKKERA